MSIIKLDFEIFDRKETIEKTIKFFNQHIFSCIDPSAFSLKEHCCVAGGAVAKKLEEGQIYSDIDVFFFDASYFYSYVKLLEKNHYVKAKDLEMSGKNSKAAKYCKMTNLSATNELRQIDVILSALDVKSLLNDFDFTVAKAAITKNNIYFHQDFFKDLKDKRLRFESTTQNPKKLLIRLQKYIKKGFTASDEELSKINDIIQGKKDNPATFVQQQPISISLDEPTQDVNI